MNTKIKRLAVLLPTLILGSHLALAANPLVLNVSYSPTPFYTKVQNENPVMNISYDYNTGGYPDALVDEEIRDANNMVVYEFGQAGADVRTTGKINLTWDGKSNIGQYNGEYVPTGEYKLYIYSETQSPPPAQYTSPTFQVINTVNPTISFQTQPATTFVPTLTQNYSIKYNIDLGTGTDAVVKLVLEGTNGKTTLTSNPAQSGSYEFLWDGKINNLTASPGEYKLTLDATTKAGAFTLNSNNLTANLTVSELKPLPILPKNCAGFTDVPANDPNCSAIEFVKSLGAMTGNPDGTFEPNELLQRDQIAKIALETFKKFNKQNNYCLNENPFPDVTEKDWAFQYICRAKQIALITGYKAGADAGFFRPARNVNRVEFLAILLRNLNDSMPEGKTSYNDVDPSQWYSGYAKYSKDLGLFAGNNLQPLNFTTRGEVAEIIFKLHLAGKL